MASTWRGNISMYQAVNYSPMLISASFVVEGGAVVVTQQDRRPLRHHYLLSSTQRGTPSRPALCLQRDCCFRLEIVDLDRWNWRVGEQQPTRSWTEHVTERCRSDFFFLCSVLNFPVHVPVLASIVSQGRRGPGAPAREPHILLVNKSKNDACTQNKIQRRTN
jgi:hypothetical protein